MTSWMYHDNSCFWRCLANSLFNLIECKKYNPKKLKINNIKIKSPMDWQTIISDIALELRKKNSINDIITNDDYWGKDGILQTSLAIFLQKIIVNYLVKNWDCIYEETGEKIGEFVVNSHNNVFKKIKNLDKAKDCYHKIFSKFVGTDKMKLSSDKIDNIDIVDLIIEKDDIFDYDSEEEEDKEKVKKKIIEKRKI